MPRNRLKDTTIIRQGPTTTDNHSGGYLRYTEIIAMYGREGESGGGEFYCISLGADYIVFIYFVCVTCGEKDEIK